MEILSFYILATNSKFSDNMHAKENTSRATSLKPLNQGQRNKVRSDYYRWNNKDAKVKGQMRSRMPSISAIQFHILE